MVATGPMDHASWIEFNSCLSLCHGLLGDQSLVMTGGSVWLCEALGQEKLLTGKSRAGPTHVDLFHNRLI